MQSLKLFLHDENGSGLIDYCILSCCVSAALIGPLRLIGQRLSLVFMTIANALAIQ